VLIGPRIAEIGEHPVAHVLRDKFAGPLMTGATQR
jgi:hypothetical protein